MRNRLPVRIIDDIIFLSPVPGGVRIFRIGCVQVQNIMNIPVVHEPAGDICEDNAVEL